MGLTERKQLGQLAKKHGLTVMPDPSMRRSYIMARHEGWWMTAEREIIDWSELHSATVNWEDIENRLLTLSVTSTFN